jgi:hypothetical protein
MDKSEISPDGSETAVNMTLFPPAWKPHAKHISLSGTELESGYFSVEDTACRPDGEGDHAAAQGVQAAQKHGVADDLAS